MKIFITTHKDKLFKIGITIGLVLAVIGAAYAQVVRH